jgi:hypothetical protein
MHSTEIISCIKSVVVNLPWCRLICALNVRIESLETAKKIMVHVLK